MFAGTSPQSFDRVQEDLAVQQSYLRERERERLAVQFRERERKEEFGDEDERIVVKMFPGIGTEWKELRVRRRGTAGHRSVPHGG